MQRDIDGDTETALHRHVPQMLAETPAGPQVEMVEMQDLLLLGDILQVLIDRHATLLFSTRPLSGRRKSSGTGGNVKRNLALLSIGRFR